MLGAGTFINPVIKVVTVVAILAASYFFVVGPILDTTEKAVDRAGSEIARSQQESRERGEASQLQFARSRALGRAQGLRAGSTPWHEAADAVIRCVRKAKGDLRQMERCEAFGSTLVTGVHSNRSFANSYADSLATQGKLEAANRVRDCVRKAGFRAPPMQRCRDLADQLLFG